jgi:hypothetical protein
MAATVQSQAIQASNDGIGCAQQVMSLFTQLVQLQQQWQDVNVGGTLSSMSTVALNADGSLGASDATPNPNHPIDPAKYPGIARAVTSTQIAQIKTILDGIVDYVNGQAVQTQPGARAILNVVVGG